jgi:hypothetical protein
MHVVDPSDEEPKEGTERRRVGDTLDEVGRIDLWCLMSTGQIVARSY